MNKHGVMMGLIVLTLVGLAGVASHYGEWEWMRDVGDTWRGRGTVAATSHQSTSTDGRLALVIGNEAYTGEAVLSNPVNDAVAMGQLLQRAGFEVVSARNTQRQELENVIADFLRRLRASGSGAGLFYYSGHGMQVGGKNYLIPVDAQIRDEHDVPGQAVALERVLDGMDQRGGGTTNLVILDACRNNPFQGVRGGRRGLVQEKVPDSTLILYAAKPGMVASDNRQGRNGLFTHYLVEALSQPGVKVRDALDQVAGEVYRASGEKQLPWLEGVLLTPLVLIPGQSLPPTVTTTPIDEDAMACEALKSSVNPAGFEAYLQNFPQGQCAGFAKIRLADLKTPVVRPVVNPVTPPTPAPIVITPPTTPSRQHFEPEMVRLPGGCFQMGSPASEKDRDSDERQHEVCVDSFEIGKYEVTQGEWQAVMGSNPSNFKSGDRYPVETVSWNDVLVYVKALNRRTEPQYRLPTEAEWEYACRGGKAGHLYCGGHDIDPVAWYYENSGEKTQRVGQKVANGFGLYDMSGNVWEWTCSLYDREYGGSEKECNYDNTNSPRSLRGGAWYYGPTRVRSAYRFRDTPTNRYFFVGFRLARSL